MSNDFADFARVIAVRGTWKKCGERSDIGTKIREIGEDGEFRGNMVGPTDEEERYGVDGWASKVSDKRHAGIDQI